ncbi:MAG: 3-keto-5-aminohexanoate cleavage protein [Alphaproteobacteria bacterium]|nr:3-keto-5-aminohexanoate cleavage protein [Alphaproteobacteria bacterium]MBU0795129.1 3-keto-5-aminohexanoate cleavage protein [Alphaproteobacteria bacterium]MBU0876491.1 3-keto-5-aminohexanoate cleavage protein [Alphaproteobacteria bacterium]MBU1768317.1 3-keto-5-aminohexanoate cleavage protein [Alphaproteobacteria bacterium]
MRKHAKVIITCAPTGSIHTPSMSPHLPVSADEIAQAAIGAAEAGAAILHLHARNPQDGSPSPRAADFMAFLPRIRQASDAVINISTGGSATMSLDDRVEGAKRAQPELCSLNMGPLIFDFSGAAKRVAQWQHDWEQPYVEGSRGRIMYNDNAYIERIMLEVGREFGTRFEFECYDIGHLYTLAHFADRGLIDPPFLIQGVFGILGGIGAEPRNLAHMVTIADSLFGEDYVFSAFAAGRHQLSFCTQSALLGGNVRVGLEDSLFIGKGELATSNAQQVERIRLVIEALGREIASPAEARALLGLKGGDAVGF